MRSFDFKALDVYFDVFIDSGPDLWIVFVVVSYFRRTHELDGKFEKQSV